MVHMHFHASVCIFAQLIVTISCSILLPFESKLTPVSAAASNYQISNGTTADSIPNTSFRVCDKTPERVPPASHEVPHTFGLVSHFREYRQNKCTRVIQETDFGPGRVEPAGQKGFISTVLHAYKGHHNLVIRPDDIWIAIMSQFALYINGNGTAEKFRDRFVNFDGKKRLVVDFGAGTLGTVPHARFVELMSDEIHKNLIDDEVREWITLNFTTTTRDDKVAAGIILMSSMKQFFEYVENIACGIPQITLEGTEEDWKNLAARLVKLRSYELESWVDGMLGPILKQFVRAKAGKVDEEFWNSIVNAEDLCGGLIISGWITAFSVFNADGKWQAGPPALRGEGGSGKRSWPHLEIDELASGIVYADVIICDHGVRHDSVVFAGHLGQEIMDDERTLKPRIGWALALKNTTAAVATAVEGLDGDTIVVDIIEKENACADI